MKMPYSRYLQALLLCLLMLAGMLVSAQDRPFRFHFNASGLSPNANGDASINFELKNSVGPIDFKSLQLERDRGNRYEAEELIPRESEYFMVSGYWQSSIADTRYYLPIQLVHNSAYPEPNIRELSKEDRFVNAQDAFYISLHDRARTAFQNNETPLALLYVEKLFRAEDLVELNDGGTSAAFQYFHDYEDAITHPDNLQYSLTTWNNIYNAARDNNDLVMTYANFLGKLGSRNIDGLPIFGTTLGEYRINRLFTLAEQHFEDLFSKYDVIVYSLVNERLFDDCVAMSSKILDKLSGQDDYRMMVKATDGWQYSLSRYLLTGSSCLHKEYNITDGANEGQRELNSNFRDYVQQDPIAREFSRLFVDIVEEFEADYLAGVSDTAAQVQKYYDAYTGS